MDDYQYIGNELEIFAHARHWKKYINDQLSPYIRNNVLEVGSGPGNNTKNLYKPGISSWLCLEPDKFLIDQVQEKIRQKILPDSIETLHGTIGEIPSSRLFDSILYIDVLEHIEDDKGELMNACSHLEKSGRLIILVPAFQSLFSNFDRKIGHFRRYKKNGLKSLIPQGMKIEKLDYLDSSSMLVSLAARYFNKSGESSLQQVMFWDNYFVPFSRLIDPIFSFSFGKSLAGVWKKE